MPLDVSNLEDMYQMLEEAASSDDHQAFAGLARGIEWIERQPKDLIRTIDLALMLDLVPLAQELAQRGKQLFPYDIHLQQAAKVLTPPIIIGKRPAQAKHLKASRDWLAEHSSEYRGQWIAVRDGILLGTAPTLKGLYGKIGLNANSADTVVVKILPYGQV